MIFKNIDEIINNKFDVVIVGSGPAGISLALKLEEKKIKTLILEAGSEEYSEKSQHSRLRQFGGTSGHWGGWSKPMENYNLSKWGIEYNQLEKYSNQTCKILNINNNFRKSNINKYFNQIEFQYSDTRFHEKYFSHIKASKNILLLLNTQLSHFEGQLFNKKGFRENDEIFSSTKWKDCDTIIGVFALDNIKISKKVIK